MSTNRETFSRTALTVTLEEWGIWVFMIKALSGRYALRGARMKRATTRIDVVSIQHAARSQGRPELSNPFS
jgi:hypothetical protein